MKNLNHLLARGATPRQIRRGTVPKRLRRGKKAKAELKAAQLFMLTVVIKHPTVIFQPSQKWPERVPQLRALYNGLETNEGGYFIVAPTNPTLPQFDTLIDELEQYIQDVVEHKQNAKENRDAKWEEVLNAIRNLVSYVQILVRAKPAHAQQIANEATMRLKIAYGKLPQGYTAKSSQDGQVEISGVVRKQNQINDWQICLDPTDVKNWLLIKIRPSSAAKAVVNGLTSGSYYYVRHMAIIVGEEPYWEEPIRVKVK